MSENKEIEETIETCTNLLIPIYSNLEEFTTLTFAQSLDGKLSSEPNKPFILSGKESLVMTHHLRALHEGILIGINTCLSDDPKLTARFIKSPGDEKNPIPIVLDTKLRINLNCYLLTKHPKKCIIVTTDNCDKDKLKKLEEMKIKVILSSIKNGQIDLLDAINQLKTEHGIKKLMVEGGSKIIQSFLNTPNSFQKLIITIAPKLVGNLGVSISSKFGSIKDVNISVDNLKYYQLGKDCILTGDPKWSS